MLTKVKATDWIDIKTGVTWYGIKGKASSDNWYYLSEGGKALVFATEEERNLKLKELRARIAKDV